jgi:hypothetical protein
MHTLSNSRLPYSVSCIKEQSIEIKRFCHILIDNITLYPPYACSLPNAFWICVCINPSRFECACTITDELASHTPQCTVSHIE